jgi:hypothetical protein
VHGHGTKLKNQIDLNVTSLRTIEMSIKSQARENLFGYIPLYPRGAVLEFHPLLELAMSGRRNQALLTKLLDEEKALIDRLIVHVKQVITSSPIPSKVLTAAIEHELQKTKPEFHDELRRHWPTLEMAVSIGFRFGALDQSRMGLDPPVALRPHREAMHQLCETEFGIEDDAVEDNEKELSLLQAIPCAMAENIFYACRKYGNFFEQE